MADYSCKKISHTTYRLTTIHPLHTTDGQTNDTSCHRGRTAYSTCSCCASKTTCITRCLYDSHWSINLSIKTHL